MINEKQRRQQQRSQDGTIATTMDSPLHTLSPDCRQHVFVFLSLRDCLRFGETSRTSLENIILEVESRRSQQFLVRPCEEYAASPSLFCAIRNSELPAEDEVVWKRMMNHNNPSNEDDSFLYKTPDCDLEIDQSYSDGSCETSSKRPRTWCFLPSVLERIEGLYRAIPASHPFNSVLRDLVSDLKGNGDTTTDAHTCLVRRLSSVSRAHQLHASLLSRCTIELHPDSYRNESDNRSFTVTLERYMGDVLTASCLVGHTRFSGRVIMDDPMAASEYDTENYGKKTKAVVEGGVSFDQWIDHLLSYIHRNRSDNSTAMTDASMIGDGNGIGNEIPNETMSARDWYKYCIFLHSSLLRISPFTISQAKQLTCGPLSGLLEPARLHSGTLSDPVNNFVEEGSDWRRQQQQNLHEDEPLWFIPSPTYACFSQDCWDMKLIGKMKELFLARSNRSVGVLETTLNHFGPLGPSFRGRDRITTQTMLPLKLYARLMKNSLLSWKLHTQRTEIDLGIKGMDDTDILRWLRDSDDRGVLRWMKLLQDQSRKTRPMTVQPPLVTIRMTTLSPTQDTT